MDIWLVRHGEAAAGFHEDLDPPLSTRGRNEARETGAALERVAPPQARLISSPKLRAQQTGAPLAEARALSLTLEPRFIELPSPGDLGQRSAWIKQVLAGQWTAQGPDIQHWREGIVSALREITTPTVIFTHFLVINSVAAWISGEDAVMQCMPANGSVHHLHLVNGQPQWVNRGRMMESVIN